MSHLWGAVGSSAARSFFSDRHPADTRLEHKNHGVLGLEQERKTQHAGDLLTSPDGGIVAVRGQLVTVDANQSASQAQLMLYQQLMDGEIGATHACGGPFAAAALSPSGHEVVLATDLSGLMPLFFVLLSDGGFAFSTLARPLAALAGSAVDQVAFVQFVSFGYTIGQRSLFDRVTEVAPGSTVRFDHSRGRVSITEQRKAYSAVDPSFADRRFAAKALADAYTSGAARLWADDQPRGILLSGGFDTRLVLRSMMNEQQTIRALTFGDLDNYEVNVARRVAQHADADWTALNPAHYTDLPHETVSSLTRGLESVNFPLLDVAAQVLDAEGASTGSTGYGGETILGGQGYGQFLGRESDIRRLGEVALRTIGSAMNHTPVHEMSVSTTIERIVEFHRRQIKASKNRLSPTTSEWVSYAMDALPFDVEAEVDRYLASSPSAVEQIAERFWLEHHVRKHFGKQELTLEQHVTVALPTVLPEFFTLCTNLPPRLKADHGYYFPFVRHYFGELAALPTSNVPVPLTLPDGVLWATRAVRSLTDNRQVNRMVSSRGKAGGKRHGWANFEVWMRQGSFLDDILREVDLDLFDTDWLSEKIEGMRSWTKRVYSGQELLTMVTASEMVGRTR